VCWTTIVQACVSDFSLACFTDLVREFGVGWGKHRPAVWNDDVAIRSIIEAKVIGKCYIPQMGTKLPMAMLFSKITTCRQRQQRRALGPNAWIHISCMYV
jgi:hypothetical protein